jgi:hypothetical protein
LIPSVVIGNAGLAPRILQLIRFLNFLERFGFNQRIQWMKGVVYTSILLLPISSGTTHVVGHAWTVRQRRSESEFEAPAQFNTGADSSGRSGKGKKRLTVALVLFGRARKLLCDLSHSSFSGEGEQPWEVDCEMNMEWHFISGNEQRTPNLDARRRTDGRGSRRSPLDMLFRRASPFIPPRSQPHHRSLFKQALCAAFRPNPPARAVDRSGGAPAACAKRRTHGPKSSQDGLPGFQIFLDGFYGIAGIGAADGVGLD